MSTLNIQSHERTATWLVNVIRSPAAAADAAADVPADAPARCSAACSGDGYGRSARPVWRFQRYAGKGMRRQGIYSFCSKEFLYFNHVIQSWV